MLPIDLGGIAAPAKRAAVVLAALVLSACTASPRVGVTAFERVPPSRVSSGMLSPVSVAAVPLPGDTVTLLDSRVLRALRRAAADSAADGEALGLTRGQKVALWVGVTVVAAYLVADWLEDEVAFIP
jgi:hypothetical protein